MRDVAFAHAHNDLSAFLENHNKTKIQKNWIVDTYFIAMFIVELSNKFDKLQYDRHIITIQYLLSCFFYLFLHFYLSASLEHESRN